MKNFFSFIIYLLMIIIFCITVYFCLDVFGIIKVPAQYSIASIFYSKIEVIASAGESYENIIITDDTNNDIYNNINKDNNRTTYNPPEKKNIENIINFDEAIAKLNEASKEIQNPTPTVELTDVNPGLFYYSQLDDYGKILYNELYKNKSNLKTGTYTIDYGRTFNDLLNTEGGTEILNEDFQLAINALTFDNPDLFYIDVTKVYLLTEIITRPFSKTYNVSIGPNGGNYLMEAFPDEVAIDKAIKDVNDVKNRILNDNYSNDLEKVKSVHDYLVNNTEYSGDDPYTAYSVYGALVEGEAVCEGYARSFKLILDEMNIPCIIVCGIAKNSSGETESHAWNYVYLKNEWYAIDVTWDDPIIIGYGRITDSIRYEYFLKGSNKFLEDHLEDGNIVGDSSFLYPKISVADYQ